VVLVGNMPRVSSSVIGKDHAVGLNHPMGAHDVASALTYSIPCVLCCMLVVEGGHPLSMLDVIPKLLLCCGVKFEVIYICSLLMAR